METEKSLPAARRLAFDTRAIHAGQTFDPTTGAVMTPIYATSTYAQQSPGVTKGFDYARSQNPTRFAFERCVADLEEGNAAFAFASGLAAIATVLELLDHGSHVVVCDDLYGGSFRLFERVRRRSANLDFTYVDPTDLVGLEAAIRPNTRMLWMESPSNPLLKTGRFARRCRVGQTAKPAGGDRQHVRFALLPTPTHLRLRYRRSFGHQVPQRPLRHDRRRCGCWRQSPT